ncbi:DNA polymerase epsilon subunit 2 [Planococcus citri]|uniref:DNA polymerase epsilon subunit 2 n=1 Tax=Planococcus citri TaxID=170843 RepID=UPI0031F80E27
MDENRLLRKSIITSFRLNGLSIKGDACDYLVSQLGPVTEEERSSWISKVTEFLQKKKSLSDPVVLKSHVVSAVDECCKSEMETADDVFFVIGAFDVPKFNYHHDTKKFIRRIDAKRNVFAEAEHRIKHFSDRYTMIKQRIDRHELLSSRNKSSDEAKLRTIDYLLSCAAENEKVVVFGILAQLQEGKYFLEDPSGILPLNLSQAIYHNGLFAENCLILAEGEFCDGVLCVHGLAMPPPESSKISRTYFGNANTFGGPSEVSLKTSARMMKIEESNEEAMIVFISDIWLDNAKVLDKIRMLLAGYDEYSPLAIVLMGDFLSKPYGNQHSSMFRDKFKELAVIISHYKNLLAETTFIIVPGPTDSPYANILPRPPLPSFLTEEFSKRVPKSIFTTNPCRIQYCTQEIVVFREDILTKMCRNCVHFPESGDVSLHFVKTILSQCYLTPVPLSVCPVYWSEGAALTIYPLPDVLVVADQRSPFNITHKDCVVFNPSSFSLRQFCFTVYVPASKQVEDSQISTD